MSRQDDSNDELWLTAWDMRSELTAYLQRFTGGRSEAEDLMQAMLERLLSRRGEGSLCEPQRYIRKTARSVGIDWQRQRRARVDPAPLDALEEPDLIDSQGNPFDEVMRDQEWALINRIVKALAPRCREVFILCRIEGYSHAAVAERLNITVGTVRAHLQHASLTIEDELGELTMNHSNGRS